MTSAVVFVAGPVPPLDEPSHLDCTCGSSRSRSLAVSGSDASNSFSNGLGNCSDDNLGPGPADSLGIRLRSRIADIAPDLMIAADGGLDLALALGCTPGYLIGDMDSVTSESMKQAESNGTEVTTFPRAKDASDYELALDRALELGASQVTVIGGAGGRIDHVMATIMTLGAAKYRGLVLDAWLADNYLAVLNGSSNRNSSVGVPNRPETVEEAPWGVTLQGCPGSQVSMFALGGPAEGVWSQGLRWELDGRTLTTGTSLGVSNELTRSLAKVGVTTGCLAVVLPQIARNVSAALTEKVTHD